VACSTRETTPVSRSRISQPSVRTISLTQNGSRHSTSITIFSRPWATLAMYQAAGNASSSVNTVASTDMTAVRTKVFQYSGSSTKVRNWFRLNAYSPGPTRACSDSRASSTCGNSTSPPSHSRAGASRKASIQRRWVAM
jgi:hypothetical protein